MLVRILLLTLDQGDTSKLLLLVAVEPFTVTLIVPVETPDGTVTDSDELVAELTVADTPLNATLLLDVVEEKLEPLIVTTVPAIPKLGEKLLIDTLLELELVLVVVSVSVLVPVLVPTCPQTTHPESKDDTAKD
ncbi:MAG: hypothetical protein AAF518_21990, partial [Spirochaetota bacterium]